MEVAILTLSLSGALVALIADHSRSAFLLHVGVIVMFLNYMRTTRRELI
jgi:hypothetical protein